jgi:2-iminoacetate synthase ThiH
VDDESEGSRRATLEEVRRNIRAAALVPVERDGAYGRIG